MNNKTFGFWKEYGKSYDNYPSIVEYINKDINSIYDKCKLIKYLTSGGIVCVTSNLSFPNVITKKSTSGTLAIRTDGLWEWPDNLVEYIDHYDVFIPEEWYEYIKSNNFTVSEDVKKRLTDIDW